MSKLAFWNSADLHQPAADVCVTKISVTDAETLAKTFQDASSVLNGLNKLDFEAALLSRVIWKLKTKFHTDKAFHRLEAVNRGLLKYLKLDIKSVYHTFKTLLTDVDPKGSLYLSANFPSRQMLEWVLVRTQGFARLFCYVANCCEEAGHGWLDISNRTYMRGTCAIVLGILGRIWTFSRYILHRACDWYNELLPFVDILKSVGVRWLPSNYKLPQDLKLWLNMPHITNSNVKKQGTSKSVSEICLMRFLDMSDDEDNATNTSIPPMPLQLEFNSLFESATKRELDRDVGLRTDIGELVSREEFAQDEQKPTNFKKNHKKKLVKQGAGTSVQKGKKAKKMSEKLAMKKKKKSILMDMLN